MKKSYLKTANDTILNAGAELLLIPLAFIRLPILTKNLTTQEYGLWGLIFTTCSLMLPFASLGLGPVLSRFIPSEKDKNQVQEIFYSVLFVRLVIVTAITLSFLIFASIIAEYFFDGNIEIVRITSAFIFLTTMEPLYMRMVVVFRKVKMLSIIKIVNGYGLVAVYAILLLNSSTLFDIVIASLIFNIVIVAILIYVVTNRIGFKFPNFSRLKELLKFGLPTIPSSMSFWLVNLTDRYIITFLLSAASVGIYSASYSLGQVPYLFSALINFIIMIAISELFDQGKLEEVKVHLSYSLKYFLTLTIPYVFGTAIMGKQVLLVLSTHEIAKDGQYVAPIIALSHLFLGIYAILINILMVTKKTKVLLYVWLISAPLNIGLNFIIIPYFGLVGAALSTLVAYLLSLGIVSYFSLKEITFDANVSFIIKSIFASVIMCIVIWIISPNEKIDTILTIVAGMLTYGIVLILLGGFSNKEFILFKELLINLFKKKILSKE